MREGWEASAFHAQLWPCQSALVGKDKGWPQAAREGGAPRLGGRPSWLPCGLEARPPQGRVLQMNLLGRFGPHPTPSPSGSGAFFFPSPSRGSGPDSFTDARAGAASSPPRRGLYTRVDRPYPVLVLIPQARGPALIRADLMGKTCLCSFALPQKVCFLDGSSPRGRTVNLNMSSPPWTCDAYYGAL